METVSFTPTRLHVQAWAGTRDGKDLPNIDALYDVMPANLLREYMLVNVMLKRVAVRDQINLLVNQAGNA